MDYKEIKQLIEDMGKSNLNELDIEFPEGIKISMKKDEKTSTYVLEQATTPSILKNTTLTKNQIKDEEKSQNEDAGKYINSPMVGTYYSKSSPTTKSFVEIGSKVKKGDVLCIIEAMKLMNEIEAEYDGEIIEIFAKDEEMVDYGKKLFKIK